MGGIKPSETAFVPRGLYGAYIRHLLDHGLRNTRSPRIELLHDEVLNVEDRAQEVTLRKAMVMAVIPQQLRWATWLPRIRSEKKGN